MSALVNPLKWFYHEFGLVSIHATGRNAYLIIAARCLRMIAHGANALILALFLAELGFPDYSIGAFMSATLLGDVILGGFLTLIADRFGRRKVLVGGSIGMVLTGLAFAYLSNYWVLLILAIFGVVSATGGDFGPFRSIEESILSQLTTQRTRADVLSWYVTTSTLGAALGSEIGGRIIHALQDRGYALVEAYHALFLSYVVTGCTNIALVMMLTNDCEIERTDVYSQVPQDESDEVIELPESGANAPVPPAPAPLLLKEAPPSRLRRLGKGLSSRLSKISTPTLKIMVKLWFLLAIDSLADGLVPYALTNYYMEEKFHPSKSTLGDINGIAHLLGAISTTFAGILARKIGLINTMVFTHVPSSASVLVFPLPSQFPLAVILFFIRAGLNSLDQAPRSAFIAAVCKPEERTAALGITSMVRTMAAMIGPSFTGILAESQQFWIAFVVAGCCRLVYDFGLYALFINLKILNNDGSPEVSRAQPRSPRLSDEEDFAELNDLAGSDESDSLDKNDSLRESAESSKSPSLMPVPEPQVRRRSPSPLAR